MKKERIDSMKQQLVPSLEVRKALEEKLSAAPSKKRVPYQKYIAMAACAALLITAYPIYRLTRTQAEPDAQPRHSYTLIHAGTGGNMDAAEWGVVTENTQPAVIPAPNPNDGGVAVGTAPVEGDMDVMMTPEELEDMLLQYGVTPQELEGKRLSSTWALWWRYVHENGGQVTLDGLEEFLNQDENKMWVVEVQDWWTQHAQGPNGAIAVEPGGLPDVQAAPEPFLVDQAQALAQYAALFDRFEAEYGPRQYPEWYGGAWLDNSFDDRVARLVVLVVQKYDSKELCLQIQDWAGGELMFTTCKYSLSYLRNLQEQVSDEMHRLGLLAGCGVDEQLNRLELILTEVTDEALIYLAQLDPEDDAIDVKVGPAGVWTNGYEYDSPESPVSYDVTTGTVTVGPPIPARDGSGEVSTPPYNPIARPGEPGYIAPAGDPADPLDLPTLGG